MLLGHWLNFCNRMKRYERFQHESRNQLFWRHRCLGQKKETAAFPMKNDRFDNWLPGTDSNRRQGG